MSLTHVVLFKFASEAESLECVQLLRGMAGRIPEMRSLRAGVNLVPSARSYDVALVVELHSLDDLATYSEHPVHKPVKEWINGRATSVAAADFEV